MYAMVTRALAAVHNAVLAEYPQIVMAAENPDAVFGDNSYPAQAAQPRETARIYQFPERGQVAQLGQVGVGLSEAGEVSRPDYSYSDASARPEQFESAPATVRDYQVVDPSSKVDYQQQAVKPNVFEVARIATNQEVVHQAFTDPAQQSPNLQSINREAA